MSQQSPVGTGVASDLHRYLQESRESVLASLEGLTEYEIRRPMTASGTNLLGLIKHLAGVELGYLGDSVGRPSPVRLPWVDDESIWDNADMWATAEETRDDMVALYRAAWQHSDQSIDELGLDAPAHQLLRQPLHPHHARRARRLPLPAHRPETRPLTPAPAWAQP